MTVIISDTSPITNLIAIGRVEILEQLFGRVFIPPAVEAELRVNHECLPDFIETLPLETAASRIVGMEDLGAGEMEAILLAKQMSDPVLLVIDERKGRKIAVDAGITCTGLLGVLLQAKENGCLDRIAPALDELKENEFYFDETIEQRVLKLAGESG